MTALLDFIASVGPFAIGLAFLYSGGRKLRDLVGTRIAVLDYRLIPVELAGPVALVLGASEVVVGAGLVAGYAIAIPLGFLLLAVLSAAAASALLRGLRIACHCFDDGEPLSAMTLARNAMFAIALAASLLLTWPPASLFTPRLLLAPLAHLLALGFAAVFVLVSTAAFRLFRHPATIEGGRV